MLTSMVRAKPVTSVGISTHVTEHMGPTHPHKKKNTQLVNLAVRREPGGLRTVCPALC